jgi:hypothetical protein
MLLVYYGEMKPVKVPKDPGFLHCLGVYACRFCKPHVVNPISVNGVSGI